MVVTTLRPQIVKHGQRLVLVGAGPSHLQLLRKLAARPVPGQQTTLVSPHALVFQPAMLASFIAAGRTRDACSVALEPLVQRSGVHWLPRRAVALLPDARTVQLDNGDTLDYDLLSIDVEGTQDRARTELDMPGAREHAMFLRPLDAFVGLWPRVAELAPEPLRSLAVIGDGTLAIEIALALRRLRPQLAISLIVGPAGMAPRLPPGAREAIRRTLQRGTINLLPDRVVGLQAGRVHLGCGAELVCDLPLIASVAQTPAWLQRSGLALSTAGELATEPCLRSLKHLDVFLPMLDPSRRAGALLHANLTLLRTGAPVRAASRPARSVEFVALDHHRAIVSCGAWWMHGYWAWRWKDWLDQRQSGGAK